MKKGTIMTIDRKHAYVFTQDCRMVRMAWQPGMVIGKEIPVNMNNESATTPKPASRKTWRPALAIASLAVLLAAALFFGRGLIFSPVYARLSIDVNPSIEFDLNRQLEVLAVRTLNQEAEQVLAGENLKGLPWQEAVEHWADLLRLRYSQQIQAMLISAVLPDQASQFTEQLMNMERTTNEGSLAGLQIRVIYSKDPAVVQSARQNGLSVGRQMLLNQAMEQHQNYDSTGIADAPLGDLIQTLLRAGQPDQTGMTRKTTQSLSDPSGPTASQGTGATQQHTNSQTTGSGSQQTNRETNQATNGSTGSQAGGQTNGSQQSGGNGPQNGGGASSETSCSSEGTPVTAQSTLHSTLQSTLQSTSCEPTGTTGGSTQANGR